MCVYVLTFLFFQFNKCLEIRVQKLQEQELLGHLLKTAAGPSLPHVKLLDVPLSMLSDLPHATLLHLPPSFLPYFPPFLPSFLSFLPSVFARCCLKTLYATVVFDTKDKKNNIGSSVFFDFRGSENIAMYDVFFVQRH